jgi:hypothetical protein
MTLKAVSNWAYVVIYAGAGLILAVYGFLVYKMVC